MKKIAATLLAFALILGIGSVIPASAASITTFPIKAYPRNTGKTYATNGTSWAGDYDLCNITAVNISAGTCTATYPLDGGGTSQPRTFALSKFFSNSGFVTQGNTIASATVYRRSSGNDSADSINTTGDTTVWVLGLENNRLQIIYKVTGQSYYKMGWVPWTAVRTGTVPTTTTKPATTTAPPATTLTTFGDYANSEKWRVTQRFNDTSTNHKGHLGIDIVTKGSDAVRAVFPGTVVYARSTSNNGYTVTLRHTINGRTFYSLYSHMKSNLEVYEGQPNISAGSILGYQGSTGNSTGAHLHLCFYQGTAVADMYGYNRNSAGTAVSFSSPNGYWDYQSRRFFDPIRVIQTNGQIIATYSK
ncbi:MAG: M23 family metallopeptidase [Oscillospiraceae bacterium]|nr:M23 family metallopeptidase [Oscillospiraceae bacterium]